MDTDKIYQIVAKMGITVQEAQTLFNHFAAEFIKEQCSLDIQMDSNSDYECDTKYQTVNIEITIKNGENILLSERNYTSFSVS